MEAGIELDKLIMPDKEVGERWKWLISSIGVDPSIVRNREIQLILKLVEERVKVLAWDDREGYLEYDFNTVPKNEYGEVQYDQLALKDFGIDYQEYLACITKLQIKS